MANKELTELEKAYKELGIPLAGDQSETEPTLDIIKAENDTLKKSVEEKDQRITELEAQIESGASADVGEQLSKAVVDEVGKKVESVGILTKAVIDSLAQLPEVLEMVKGLTDSLEERFDNMDERLATIADKPMVRKSIHANNPQHLKKAFEIDSESGKKILSKAVHRTQIVELLDTLAGDIGSGDENQMYQDACVRYETSGELTKAVQDDLFTKHEIKIID